MDKFVNDFKSFHKEESLNESEVMTCLHYLVELDELEKEGKKEEYEKLLSKLKEKYNSLFKCKQKIEKVLNKIKE